MDVLEQIVRHTAAVEMVVAQQVKTEATVLADKAVLVELLAVHPQVVLVVLVAEIPDSPELLPVAVMAGMESQTKHQVAAVVVTELVMEPAEIRTAELGTLEMVALVAALVVAVVVGVQVGRDIPVVVAVVVVMQVVQAELHLLAVEPLVVVVAAEELLMLQATPMLQLILKGQELRAAKTARYQSNIK